MAYYLSPSLNHYYSAHLPFVEMADMERIGVRKFSSFRQYFVACTECHKLTCHVIEIVPCPGSCVLLTNTKCSAPCTFWWWQTKMGEETKWNNNNKTARNEDDDCALVGGWKRKIVSLVKWMGIKKKKKWQSNNIHFLQFWVYEKHSIWAMWFFRSTNLMF